MNDAVGVQVVQRVYELLCYPLNHGFWELLVVLKNLEELTCSHARTH